jgi:hypothetical protein
MLMGVLGAVVTPSVQAAGLVVPAPAGIQLKTAALMPCPEADVCFENNRVEAQFGIRIESHAVAFAPLSPLVLEEPYVARDASGEEFRVVVRGVVGNRVFLEVAPVVGPSLANPATSPAVGFAGSFRVNRVRIAGEETDPRYPILVLERDGTYRLGNSEGVWNLQSGKVALSGHFAEWGEAEVGPGGDCLTFRFRRDALDFEILASRVVEAGSPKALPPTALIARDAHPP